MAPSAGTTGVPSIYGDDGDSRGVWGSTRELHLKVGAHLRESRAARSDERYKNFVAYARRREEEREDAPDRGRGGEGAEGGAEGASSSNARNGARPGRGEEPPSGDPTSPGTGRRETRQQKSPNDASASPASVNARRAPLGPPVRVGGGYKRDDTSFVDDDAPVDPRERRMPKPEPPRRWEEIALETRDASASHSAARAPAEVDEDPTLLMLKAVEKAALDLGVKRTGVWTALGKPYAVEGPPTVTPPANPRAAFPQKTKHPDDVAEAVARRREEARAGIRATFSGKFANGRSEEPDDAMDAEDDEEVEVDAREKTGSPKARDGAESERGDALGLSSRNRVIARKSRPETPLRDVLFSSLGFGSSETDAVTAADADAARIDPRAAYRERKAKGRFDRGALEASAARVRLAKHGGIPR